MKWLEFIYTSPETGFEAKTAYSSELHFKAPS